MKYCIWFCFVCFLDICGQSRKKRRHFSPCRNIHEFIYSKQMECECVSAREKERERHKKKSKQPTHIHREREIFSWRWLFFRRLLHTCHIWVFYGLSLCTLLPFFLIVSSLFSQYLSRRLSLYVIYYPLKISVNKLFSSRLARCVSVLFPSFTNPTLCSGLSRVRLWNLCGSVGRRLSFCCHRSRMYV